MNNVERLMWLTMDRQWLIPRLIKEGFAEEWAKGNEDKAVLLIALWQLPLMVALIAAVVCL